MENMGKWKIWGNGKYGEMEKYGIKANTEEYGTNSERGKHAEIFIGRLRYE
jgi:hypothetical protein